MIKPTVGRIVYYTPYESDEFPGASDREPLAAIIVRVWSDTCVNLSVFDANGHPHSRTSVLLVQPEHDRPERGFCEWMPYQVKKERGSESGEKEAGVETI